MNSDESSRPHRFKENTVESKLSRPLCKAAIFFALANTLFAQTKDGGIYSSGLPNNALSEAEMATGYQLLWNGKDYTGWGAADNACRSCAPGANWAIVTTKGLESGDKHKSLTVDSNMLEVAQAGPSIFTLDSTYRDFDWKMEWAAPVGAAGNAGMAYHFRIDVSTDNNLSSPEYQLSNKEWTSEWTDPTTAAGCNYDMIPLLGQAKNSDNSPSWLRAEGHWNQSRVISFGTRTAHFGNGLRLLEYQMFSAVWQTAYDASKYKPKQGTTGVYNKLHAGSFFVQDHGQAYMKFRNLRVKRLSATENPWAPNSPYLNKAAAAKGDSTLIDTLGFDVALFPTTKLNNPNTIAPRIGAKVSVDGNGLYIVFSESGKYTVTLEDARGITYESHRVQGSQYFLSGRFTNHPQFLTIYNRGERIHQSLIGAK
jgi:hypothetical protein